MKKLVATVILMAALVACGKKDNEDKGKKETAPTSGTSAPAKPTEPPAKPPEPTEPPAKPPEPPPPADPTASWTEQKGAGFSVLAARAATEQKMDVPSAAGPQPMTMYSGYHPASLKGAFQVALADMSAVAKKTKTKIDPDKTLADSVAGWKKSIPGLTVDNQSEVPGEKGLDLRASGNHPQGGPFKMRGRVIYKKERLYTVQAIYTDAKDAPLADKFIESFKITE